MELIILDSKKFKDFTLIYAAVLADEEEETEEYVSAGVLFHK